MFDARTLDSRTLRTTTHKHTNKYSVLAKSKITLKIIIVCVRVVEADGARVRERNDARQPHSPYIQNVIGVNRWERNKI